MAFLERRGREVDAAAKELGIDVPVKPAAPDSVFSRFAGIYHSFGALEREVRESIADRKWLNVEFRLFGRRFDSLGSLLEKVEADDAGLGMVERYVLALCAKQLLTEVAKSPSPDRKTAAAFEELSDRYRPQLSSVAERVDRLIDALRPKATGDSADMVEFTLWFERHFLVRATRVGERHDCAGDSCSAARLRRPRQPGSSPTNSSPAQSRFTTSWRKNASRTLPTKSAWGRPTSRWARWRCFATSTPTFRVLIIAPRENLQASGRRSSRTSSPTV
jgi:hypothetical protein